MVLGGAGTQFLLKAVVCLLFTHVVLYNNSRSSLSRSSSQEACDDPCAEKHFHGRYRGEGRGHAEGWSHGETVGGAWQEGKAKKDKESQCSFNENE